MKKYILIILSAMLIFLTAGCTEETQMKNTTTNKKTTNIISTSTTEYSTNILSTTTKYDEKIVERERSLEDSKIELLRDLNFSKGFSVSKFHANTSNGIPLGYLDYEGLKADGDYVWSVAQWGCTKNLLESTYTKDGSVISYYDTSKLLKVDTSKTGCVSLEIKGSLEYPLDENGEYSERMAVEDNWPHIIIGQDFDEYASLNNIKNLYFEIDYTITKCERLTKYAVDESMHAGQFQWFVTIYNNNPESSSYGDTMWFGFSMFDTRSIGHTPGGMLAFDGGKEDSTGLLIYMFSLDQANQLKGNTIDSLPSAVVGKKMSIKVDAVPFIKQAIKSAQKKGIFEDATIDDLVFGSTNIGFEIPGSYDLAVDIDYMNLYIVK